MEPEVESHRFAVAKVVIVGDSGVGKSTLAASLAGQPFRATESTDNRRFFELSAEPSQDGVERQILLWDLPGQPEYRLVHQLHLEQASAAVLAVDASSEGASASIAYWSRILRGASGSASMKVFLVATRIDRGLTLASEQVKAWMERFRFDGYVATSAKTGQGVAEVANMVRSAIDWSVVPTAITPKAMWQVSEFLQRERERERLLVTCGDLFREFLTSSGLDVRADRVLFDAALRLAEHRGTIRRLSFGDLVLLQPYVLDEVATAIIHAARQDPYGLGTVNEDALRTGQALLLAQIPEDMRALIILAAIEELLRHDIAFRETGGQGSFLVFPSLAEERRDRPPAANEDVVYSFEGNADTVYATLVVRLARSDVFRKEALWAKAATFKSPGTGISGVGLRAINDARAELAVFYTQDVEPHIRMLFQGFVAAHLHRMALPGSVLELRIVRCPTCSETFTDQQVRRRLQSGHLTLICPVCESRVPIPDASSSGELFEAMERNAATARDRDTAATSVRGKETVGEYDVFLSYNAKDRPFVRDIAATLRKHGVMPWFDEWELRPGSVWQTELEAKIDHIKAVAVFIGNGEPSWEDHETRHFLRSFASRQIPIIPVVLPYARMMPRLPVFAVGSKAIDCRSSSDPVAELQWAITGVRSVS